MSDVTNWPKEILADGTEISTNPALKEPDLKTLVEKDLRTLLDKLLDLPQSVSLEEVMAGIKAERETHGKWLDELLSPEAQQKQRERVEKHEAELEEQRRKHSDYSMTVEELEYAMSRCYTEICMHGIVQAGTMSRLNRVVSGAAMGQENRQSILGKLVREWYEANKPEWVRSAGEERLGEDCEQAEGPSIREYNLRPDMLDKLNLVVSKVQYKDGSFGVILSLALINNCATGELVTIHVGDKTCALKWVKELEEAVICLKKCYEMDGFLLDGD